MHRLKSQKNWAAGENIGEERTWYQLKSSLFKGLFKLGKSKTLIKSARHTFLATPFAACENKVF